MRNFAQNIFNSLSTKDGGYSARKLSALVLMLCVVAAHIKWITLGDFSQLEMVLTIDYAAIASFLGMTTYQAITSERIKKESQSQTQDNNTPPGQ